MQDPQQNSSSKSEPKLWPSERIPQGGLFHTPKVEYSKETADLLKCKYVSMHSGNIYVVCEIAGPVGILFSFISTLYVCIFWTTKYSITEALVNMYMYVHIYIKHTYIC